MFQKIIRRLLQALHIRCGKKQIPTDKGVPLLNPSDFNVEWNKLGISVFCESNNHKDISSKEVVK